MPGGSSAKGSSSGSRRALDERPVQAWLARVVAEDEGLDVALLEITGDVFGRALEPRHGPAAPLRPPCDRSPGLRRGDPRALGTRPTASWRPRTPIVITRGTVCGLERDAGEPRWIKIDAWTSQGGSGGALIDAEGHPRRAGPGHPERRRDPRPRHSAGGAPGRMARADRRGLRPRRKMRDPGPSGRVGILARRTLPSGASPCSR